MSDRCLPPTICSCCQKPGLRQLIPNPSRASSFAKRRRIGPAVPGCLLRLDSPIRCAMSFLEKAIPVRAQVGRRMIRVKLRFCGSLGLTCDAGEIDLFLGSAALSRAGIPRPATPQGRPTEPLIDPSSAIKGRVCAVAHGPQPKTGSSVRWMTAGVKNRQRSRGPFLGPSLRATLASSQQQKSSTRSSNGERACPLLQYHRRRSKSPGS